MQEPPLVHSIFSRYGPSRCRPLAASEADPDLRGRPGGGASPPAADRASLLPGDNWASPDPLRGPGPVLGSTPRGGWYSRRERSLGGCRRGRRGGGRALARRTRGNLPFVLLLNPTLATFPTSFVPKSGPKRRMEVPPNLLDLCQGQTVQLLLALPVFLYHSVFHIPEYTITQLLYTTTLLLSAPSRSYY